MAVILAFVVLFFSFLGIVYYQHPDDMDQARGSRWVAVFALWLVIYMPVYSSIDFAAVAMSCKTPITIEEDLAIFLDGGCTAPVKTMLYVLVWLCAVMSYFVIPFTLVLRNDSLSK